MRCVNCLKKMSSIDSNSFVKRKLVLLVLAAVLQACSVTKYIPEKESLYDRVEIKLEPQGHVPRQKQVMTQLEALAPEPDKSLWGWRPGLWLYYATKAENKKKGLAKRFSRAPILMKDINPDMTARKMEGKLNNNGYFKSQVRIDVSTKDKKSTVVYTVFVNPPFRVRNIHRFVV